MNRLLLIGIAVLGVACSLASVAKTWFVMPIGAYAAADTGTQTLVLSEPWATPLYKIAIVVLIVALAVLWWFGRHTSRVAVFVCSAWFVTLVFYPYCVMVCDPAIAGDAAWMEAEHRNMIWSGGDVNNSMEYRIVGAFDKLLLTDDDQEISATPMGDWQLSELSLARFPDLFERLGYSDNYFDFLRLGWMLAMIGASLILVWLWAADGKFNFVRAVSSLKVVAFLLLLGTIAAWGRSFVASAYLASAAEQTARGQYDDAVATLQRAAGILPVLREDTYFMREVGLLENARGLDTPAAQLYRASVQARYGRYQQANEVYERLIASEAPRSPICREACRGIVRMAINHLNAGHNQRAAQKFGLVLAVEPCNLKANYGMQLAQLRCKRFQAVSPLVERMDAVYSYFQYPNKRAVQFASHTNVVLADYLRGDLDAAIMNARAGVDE